MQLGGCCFICLFVCFRGEAFYAPLFEWPEKEGLYSVTQSEGEHAVVPFFFFFSAFPGISAQAVQTQHHSDFKDTTKVKWK